MVKVKDEDHQAPLSDFDFHLPSAHHPFAMSFPSTSGSHTSRRFTPINTMIASLKIVERETPSTPPPAPDQPIRPSRADQPVSASSTRTAQSSTSSRPGASSQNPSPQSKPNNRRAYGQSLVSAPSTLTSTLVAASRSLGPIYQDGPDDDVYGNGDGRNAFVKEWGREDDEIKGLFEQARVAMEMEMEAAERDQAKAKLWAVDGPQGDDLPPKTDEAV